MQWPRRSPASAGPRADDLRKAIGKKDRAEDGRPEGGVCRGLPPGRRPTVTIESLWKMNEDAADYSFNKSHAACYGLIAYRTAWLKANYPAEYMAALISSVMSTKDKVPFFVVQCEAMGIEVLPPDVNESRRPLHRRRGQHPLRSRAVKGVGGAAVDAIIAAREKDGPFDSLWDFCERVDSQMANKRVLEALIRSGAFDSTGDPRRGMIEVLPLAMSDGERKRKDAANGQGGLFDTAPSEDNDHQRPAVPQVEFDRGRLLALEKEALGLYVSAHPLEGLREQLHNEIDYPVSRLADAGEGAFVWTGGIVAAPRSPWRERRHHALLPPRGHRRRRRVRAWPKRLRAVPSRPSRRGRPREGAGRVERRPEDDTMLIAIEVVPFTGVSEYHPLTVVIDAGWVRRTWSTTCAASSPASPARCRWCSPWSPATGAPGCASATPSRRPGRRSLRRAPGAARRELYSGSAHSGRTGGPRR